MSTIGSFAARVGVFQRSPHLMDLVVRNGAEVTDYRLWLARSINASYGTVDDSGIAGSGGLAVLDARANGLVVSPTIERKGLASAEVRRGQTSFMVDVDDYVAPNPPNLPLVAGDDDFLFARVQEKRRTSGWAAVSGAAVKNANMPIRGPILVVPNATFFGRASAVLSLSATAPAGSDCAAGASPVFDLTVQKPPPLHLVFPRPLGALNIRNTDAAETLLVCFGQGQPMVALAHGESITPTGGGFALPAISEIIVAMSGAGGGCSFSLDGVVSLQW